MALAAGHMEGLATWSDEGELSVVVPWAQRCYRRSLRLPTLLFLDTFVSCSWCALGDAQQ
jgi:hypothetical protein